MSDPVFVPGQRWVSNTESELGLGIVVENANRRVTLSFPAAGERRVYATDNAPLSRVIYDVGETITDDEGLTIKVQQRHDNKGCIIYGGATADGEPAIIAELNLDSFVQFSRPLDRLFAGQIDKNNSFILRTETLAHQHRHARSSAYGLLGPRVQLLPHQFYIAQQVAARYHPRVLLADEVGLGKTIEAGLIVHQQLLCGRAKRVLIIVPDSLVHQWLVEMLRRFNLHFTILDEETCVAIETGGDEDADAEETSDGEAENPFDSAQLVLAGLSLLVDEPARRDQALALLAEGTAPQELIDTMVAVDGNAAVRQYGVVTLDLQTATFTGAATQRWAGDLQGRGVTVQGNILYGPEVVDDALAAFEAEAPRCPWTLADRLMVALEAGAAQGGDNRCSEEQSALAAALLVALPGDDPDAPTIDLRVPSQPDGGDNPVMLLRAQYDQWRLRNPPDASECGGGSSGSSGSSGGGEGLDTGGGGSGGGGTSSGPPPVDPSTSTASPSTSSEGSGSAEQEEPGGCSCRAQTSPSWLGALLGLLLVRPSRRRRGASRLR